MAGLAGHEFAQNIAFFRHDEADHGGGLLVMAVFEIPTGAFRHAEAEYQHDERRDGRQAEHPAPGFHGGMQIQQNGAAGSGGEHAERLEAKGGN